MKKTARFAAVAMAAALVLTACGERGDDDDNGGADAQDTPSAPATTEAPKESHPNFTACMVSDSGGFDDQSFNQTSHDGLENAATNFGIKTREVQSNADSEYANNIRSLVDQGCNQITTVGFLLGDATLASAKKNKKVDYAIVDYAYFDEKTGKNLAPKNLKALTFATDEPSYLAGYLAAAETETGTVGTLGGAKIPTVTIFMDGFVQGVERWNADHSDEEPVRVIGWDAAKGEGAFTDDFENKAVAQSLAETQIQQGADIIFPVAGPAGLGALQAAKDNSVFGIWVDTDGYESTDFGDILLTSVVKGMDVAVEQAIHDSIDKKTSNEPYNGTLENGGVDIAPFHDFDDEIDDDTKAEIEALRQEIISGQLTLD